jgi:predicted deacylase
MEFSDLAIPGRVWRGFLPIEGIDEPLPLIVIRGGRSGTRVLVVAGVHGDEYEGTAAAFDVATILENSMLPCMSGEVVLIPVANVRAHRAGTRCDPVDGSDLNRSFPGDPKGTFGERLAWFLLDKCVRWADCVVDLHSAGAGYDIATLCSYGGDERSRRVAVALGADTIWRGSQHTTRNLRSQALESRRIAVGVEAGGGGVLNQSTAGWVAQGVLRVMEYLDILPKSLPPLPRRRILEVGFETLKAPCDGFIVPTVPSGSSVEAGRTVARITSVLGDLAAAVTTPYPCLVIGGRRRPSIQQGDTAVWVGAVLGSFDVGA